MDPPLKPQESDCCNSGCNPCVFDVYEEQLKQFNKRQKHLYELSPTKNCVSQTTYTIFKLCHITKETEDAFLYTFDFVRPCTGELISNDLSLYYKPGQHFLIRGNSNKTGHFTRAYTPIPLEHHDNTSLSFMVLIKLYDNGQMSQFIKSLDLNTETQWRGPYGNFDIDFAYQNILFIAQGTGIAPLYAVIQTILKNETCDTLLKLFYCCKSTNNIFLRDKLYEFSAFWNFSYEVFLSNTEDVQRKYNEVVHEKRLEKIDLDNYLCHKRDKNVQVLICGSESFGETMLQFVLESDIDSKRVFVF